MHLDRMTLGRMAKKMGFVRDTLEKVCRLADVLKFMEDDELLSIGIAIKGGTAINLTITDRINKYMVANGYALSSKSKNYHALDSFVYEYVNVGGVKVYRSWCLAKAGNL